MDNKKQITFGALLSYSAIAFNIISGLLYTPWIIRTLGDDQYALYTLALSVINLFLLDFGIGAAVTKFLANYYARDQYDEADRFMGIVYKVFAAIAGGIAVCLAIFYFFIDAVYAKLTPSELTIFRHLFIIVAVYSVFSFPFTTFNGVLMANERFVEIKACNLGQKVFSVLLIVFFLLTGQGIYFLVLSHAVSNVLFLLVKYYFIKKKTRLRAKLRTWDTGIAKDLFGFSVWSTIKSIAHRCIFNIMPTVIAALIGAEEVAVFSLAATLEGYVFTFSDAVNGMFMPKISRILVSENADRQLTNLMIKVGRFHVATIGLVFIAFLCMGQHFVEVWLGSDFAAVYYCAVFLILPSLLEAPQQVAHTALIAKDIMKTQSFIYAGMAGINLLVSIAILPFLGVVGAAVSICVAYFFRTIGLNVLYHRHLPVQLGRYFKEVYSKWFIVAVATGILGTFADCYLPVEGWWGLCVKGAALCGIYIALYILVCLDKSERSKILSFIKRKGA